MSTKKTSAQTVAFRLTSMLRRLNEGKKLRPEELAKEFSVTLRTIQRDLNEKLAFLELENNDGYFAVKPARLGLLSMKDMERFAELAGLEGLHPRLSTELLQDLLNTGLQNALLVPQKAVTELLGKQFASVVLAGDKIEQRPIRTGARIGELWLVEEGLKAGERIVVEGLQKARPGTVVKPLDAATAGKP